MDHQTSMTLVLALCLACCAWRSSYVQASDAELTTDYAVPAGLNASTLDGNYFTSTLLRSVPASSQAFATVTPVNVGVFPALQGLGVSAALLQFPLGAVNVPHTHPRGTEILYVVNGILDVGLIDSTNKLFTQTLHPGDLFVFPAGLVHYQINRATDGTVQAVASFSSSNPGLIRLPNNVFKSNIADDLLSKSFGVPTSVIDQLKAATVS